jgi:hypothetical protein
MKMSKISLAKTSLVEYSSEKLSECSIEPLAICDKRSKSYEVFFIAKVTTISTLQRAKLGGRIK